MVRQLTAWWHRQNMEHSASKPGVVPLLAVLLAIPVILACVPGFVTVSNAPARDISLTITITDKGAASSSVLVQVSIMVVGIRGPVTLSSSHSLVCNGVKFNLMSGGAAQVPRQPPGGAYTFVYTDEQRQHTTLVVPVPTGAFAITTPVERATVKLPAQPSLEPSPTAKGSGLTTGGTDPATLVAIEATPVPPATPTANPDATPTPPATLVPSGSPTPVGQVRFPQQVSQPPILIRYTVPTVPNNAIATFQARATCGRNGAPTCGGDLFGPTLMASGTYALTDADVAMGYGFEAFGPGPGELSGRLTMSWPLAPGGFSTARVTFYDDTTVDITWTR